MCSFLKYCPISWSLEIPFLWFIVALFFPLLRAQLILGLQLAWCLSSRPPLLSCPHPVPGPSSGSPHVSFCNLSTWESCLPGHTGCFRCYALAPFIRVGGIVRSASWFGSSHYSTATFPFDRPLFMPFLPEDFSDSPEAEARCLTTPSALV